MVRECEVLRGRCGRGEKRRERDGFGGEREAFETDAGLGLKVGERRLCNLRESAILDFFCLQSREAERDERERERENERETEELYIILTT